MLTVTEPKNVVRNLTVRQACEEVGRQVFSEEAVAKYKQSQLEKVWRHAGPGGIWVGRHPDFFQDYTRYAINFFIAYLAVAIAAIAEDSIAHKIGGKAFAGLLQYGALWMSEIVVVIILGFVYICILASRGAVETKWMSETIHNDNCNIADAPEQMRRSCTELRALVPGIHLVVHRLQIDPLVEAFQSKAYASDSVYIGGWDGENDLVEADGQIHAWKMPKA